MRHSIAEPVQRHVFLLDRQTLAGGDAQLPLHQVEPGRQLRHRMLHLQARIHFQEIEVAIAVDQEFHGPGVRIARRARDLQRRFAHLSPQLRMLRASPAKGTPRSPSDAAAGWSIRARPDESCGRDGRPAPGSRYGAARRRASRDRLRRCETRAKLRSRRRATADSRSCSRSTRRMPFPPPPAAALSSTGYPSSSAVRARFSRLSNGLLGAGNHRRSRRNGDLPGRGFRTHLANRRRGRADEDDARRRASLGEIGVFAQKSVAGMDRVGAMPPRGVDDLVDAQIAFRRRRGPEVRGLIRHPDGQRSAVGIGVNGDAAIPASRSARMMRTAISPRLATRTFRNMKVSDCSSVVGSWHNPRRTRWRHDQIPRKRLSSIALDDGNYLASSRPQRTLVRIHVAQGIIAFFMAFCAFLFYLMIDVF